MCLIKQASSQYLVIHCKIHCKMHYKMHCKIHRKIHCKIHCKIHYKIHYKESKQLLREHVKTISQKRNEFIHGKMILKYFTTISQEKNPSCTHTWRSETNEKYFFKILSKLFSVYQHVYIYIHRNTHICVQCYTIYMC